MPFFAGYTMHFFLVLFVRVYRVVSRPWFILGAGGRGDRQQPQEDPVRHTLSPKGPLQCERARSLTFDAAPHGCAHPISTRGDTRDHTA